MGEWEITYRALILLEELNDILSKGELENDENLDSIIYQCKILINYTNE